MLCSCSPLFCRQHKLGKVALCKIVHCVYVIVQYLLSWKCCSLSIIHCVHVVTDMCMSSTVEVCIAEFGKIAIETLPVSVMLFYRSDSCSDVVNKTLGKLLYCSSIPLINAMSMYAGSMR